ncbi:DUF948 domain-containing protein [Puia dinghuensis]|uniref:Uncharacterized protein n=1 Tax=Puia dinghuensis TaxID=1792502 RepID=A0A8J2U9C8_9BACT|nr:DUF948 domain-containing protein [Puia dinghuensis]GGA88183.1 hypothetical protein GCM10011511_09210 [Puia dinghuensis]
MDSNMLIIAVAFAVLVGGFLIFLFLKQRRELKAAQATGEKTGDANTRQLQLQAYERLILLTDRIALPNLVQRLNQPGLEARDMQALLTQSIRQEFEHNITQQIYVSSEAWDAVRNYKEQNLLIINQVSSFLPPEASGIDLNKHLLDLLVQNPKASLQNVVSEVLSFEAKKLM